jgi:hypothetical protein
MDFEDCMVSAEVFVLYFGEYSLMWSVSIDSDIAMLRDALLRLRQQRHCLDALLSLEIPIMEHSGISPPT